MIRQARLPLVSLVLCLPVAVTAGLAQAPPSSARLDAAMRLFWDLPAAASAKADAAAAQQAGRAVQQVLAAGADFDTLYSRLKAGRPYSTQRTGRVDMPATDRAGTLDHVVEVPSDYDPARRWPVRVSLHGGVGRERPAAGQPARPLTNRIQIAGEIVIHPRAWLESAWWTSAAVENIGWLLDRVKRQYNVDESRVYVTGISDGGTGVYFLSMRAATSWASCLALNGHPLVLANPATGVDGRLFAGNLANCPLYLVNGGKDPLYPASSMQRYVDMFKGDGIPVVFQVYPEAGHDVSWWPQERPKFEAFVAAHPRAAHPATVSWETERTDRYNRFRWVVIDRLGARPSDSALKDVAGALFERTGASGRADVTRRDNVIDVRTRGVRELTLLLSPDAVDFTRAVRVTVNGKPVHDAIVKKDRATLLKWAARDNDRTMLYGAELHIVVP